MGCNGLKGLVCNELMDCNWLTGDLCDLLFLTLHVRKMLCQSAAT